MSLSILATELDFLKLLTRKIRDTNEKQSNKMEIERYKRKFYINAIPVLSCCNYYGVE